MSVVRLVALRESELSVDEVRAAVADPAAGGIAFFAGAVRNEDGQRAVSGLSYSAHPSAEDELRRVAEEIAEKFRLHGVAAVHRVGDLAIGDLAVVVAAACSHRAAEWVGSALSPGARKRKLTRRRTNPQLPRVVFAACLDAP
jgi:molybdopterin synthase catalytic subunit